MSSVDTYGLDSTGKPIYQRTDTNSYDYITRLTPADIEKNTVIVPDVRLSQAGDLLVKTEADGNLEMVSTFPALPESKFPAVSVGTFQSILEGTILESVKIIV